MKRILFDAWQEESTVTQLLQHYLSIPEVREDLLNLLSFASNMPDGGREAKSWALRLWWRVMGKPVIKEFMLDVVARHNRYWTRNENK